jgi:hypothetical protein
MAFVAFVGIQSDTFSNKAFKHTLYHSIFLFVDKFIKSLKVIYI